MDIPDDDEIINALKEYAMKNDISIRATDGSENEISEREWTNILDGSPSVTKDCKVCKMLFCVCDIIAKHKKDCSFRVAACGAIAISCDEHGLDVCPECDRCDCGAENENKNRDTDAGRSTEDGQGIP